jgi:hypothetical protein
MATGESGGDGRKRWRRAKAVAVAVAVAVAIVLAIVLASVGHQTAFKPFGVLGMRLAALSAHYGANQRTLGSGSVEMIDA